MSDQLQGMKIFEGTEVRWTEHSGTEAEESEAQPGTKYKTWR